ncbi:MULTISPECIES: hypothetical protein [unclassified Janthinobacterium]|uniref:hypothetical protein n=1 Tax=unclassified Janthinobacterium TaxID=2610881 RepID=UPI00161DB8D4|nr:MULTISPECIES: hypothetical protein [unclassified Janthinobacterium]MBB5369119.1 hypothetical protein [Janthinobacterium sp. K2C7]MBB5381344.1 hypothetical protein [Janthinobacterium sp. K2Li3]MBB5387502.1 hypothetical protein [Janthinobacterium sp. K2E3]
MYITLSNYRTWGIALLAASCVLSQPASATAAPSILAMPAPKNLAALLTGGTLPRLSEDPQVRAALFDFFGYARGSYTEDDELVLEQAFEAISDRRDATRTVLPDGRQLLASMNDRNQGRERGAMLLDKRGEIIAFGLVNGHCHLEGQPLAKVCNADPSTVLTVFHRKGMLVGEAAPLLAWARQLPPMLALIASDKEVGADGQKIASVEYVLAQPPLPGWNRAQLPPAFPSALLPLLLEKSAVMTSAGAGVFSYPLTLRGKKQSNVLDQAEGRPPRDLEVAMRSYASFESVVERYRQLAKGARFQRNERTAYIDGELGQGSYRVYIRNAGNDGVMIDVALWQRKLATGQ